MKRALAYLLGLFLFCGHIDAQQTPHYSLYDMNWYAHNPAYGGMDFELRLNGIYRSQWNGLEGAPERYHLSGHLPLYAAYGGAGILVQSEEIGARQFSYYALSYNYVQSTAMGIFSIGVRPGFYQWNWDGRKISTPEGNYDEDIIDHMDPALVNEQASGSIFNIDAGIHFQNENIKAGVFASQLYPGKYFITTDAGYGLNLEWGIYGQYEYDFSDRLRFTPSAIVMSDGRRYQSAMKIGTLIDKIYYAGVGVRGYSQKTLDAVILSAGLQMSDNFWIYYNFDIGLSKLRSTHSGSHEILISYRLEKQIGGVRPPKIIYNPRYFE